MTDFDGQPRGEVWTQDRTFGEGKYARLIVACSEDGCDNDAALSWFSEGADLTPPQRDATCSSCKKRIDTEDEARREARVIEYHEQERIEELLLGHSIARSIDGALVLDDGTRLEIVTAGDCCSWYGVSDLNDCPNIITSVEFDDAYGAVIGGKSEGDTLRIFVLAEDKRINLIEVEGNPGSGYYATGYQFVVTKPGDPAADANWYEMQR